MPLSSRPDKKSKACCREKGKCFIPSNGSKCESGSEYHPMFCSCFSEIPDGQREKCCPIDCKVYCTYFEEKRRNLGSTSTKEPTPPEGLKNCNCAILLNESNKSDVYLKNRKFKL